MKTLRTLFVIAVAILGFATSSFAQAPAGQQREKATAAAKTTIITPITITKDYDLNFGDVVSKAGTVVMSPAGSRTSAENILGNSASNTPRAASFSVAGEADATFNIILPTSIDIVNGANTMRVDAFTSNPAEGANGLLDGSGDATIAVGATLTVSEGQATGEYTGNFDVTVNYN
jgi:hypothetical protein